MINIWYDCQAGPAVNVVRVPICRASVQGTISNQDLPLY